MPAFIILFTLFTLSSAHAADLKTWIDVLAQTQPESLRIEAEQTWSQAQNQQAQRWFPQGGYGILSHENDRLTGDQGLEHWEAGIGFSLWRWGQRQAQQAVAQQTAQGAQLMPALVKLAFADRLRDLAWQRQRSALLLEMAQRERRIWQTLTDGVTQAVTLGEKPLLDQRLAEQNLLLAEAALVQAQSDDLHAQASLRGWGVDTDIERLLEQPSTENWQQHPALRWQRHLVQQAQAQRRLAETGLSGQPSLELTGKREQTKFSSANTSVMMTLTLPFGEGQRLTLAERLQAQTEQQVALMILERELNQAWLQADNALKLATQQQAIAQKQMQLSQETVIMAQQAYQHGETNLSELLRTQQRSLTDTREAALATLEIGYRIARFNQALGVLPQ